MADEPSDTVDSWPQEQIPDEDKLFMRLHRQWTRDGSPTPGAFQNRGKGMSTDWAKYSTPAETLARAKKPEENGVLTMPVGKVRAIPNQTVEHTPTNSDRAHTDVFGIKDDEEVRLKFTRICRWVIDPP